jgi:hypothetical protein
MDSDNHTAQKAGEEYGGFTMKLTGGSRLLSKNQYGC